MVGVLLLAARCRDLALREDLAAVLGIRRVAGNGFDGFRQVQGRRIHRVVDTRVTDVAVHIQAFGQTHGARGADAFGCSSSHERRGVERGRRLDGALALGDLAYGCGFRAIDVRHDGVCLGLGFETSRGMRRLEGIVTLAELSSDDPVILGNESHALAFLSDDQRKGRGLDTAGRADVSVTGELHQREVTGKRSAPNKVNVLTRCTGLSQIDVKFDQVIERVGDLFFSERGVTRTGNRRRIVHFLDARKRIGTDELAFAVEVGCNDDGIGFLRQVLKRADDFLFLRQLLDRCIHQVRKRLHLP